jgi:hypothetical protein
MKEQVNTWENHHCEKHGNTQISPHLSHRLWKRLAPGMPGRSYQTIPGLPSGCQVNIKCFYAKTKSTCLGSKYRNISSLTLVQKVIPGYLQWTVDNYSWGYQWFISHDLSHGVPLMRMCSQTAAGSVESKLNYFFWKNAQFQESESFRTYEMTTFLKGLALWTAKVGKLLLESHSSAVGRKRS